MHELYIILSISTFLHTLGLFIFYILFSILTNLQLGLVERFKHEPLARKIVQTLPTFFDIK